MTTPTPLSPTAQAVMDAFTGNDTIHGLHLMTPRLAAALRAAADQVEQKMRGFSRETCQEIRAIATELEAQP